MPFTRGVSGNPQGRPRKGKSLTEIIERRLNKEEFAQRLIDISMGRIPDTPPLVAASCMRMILAYIDGLPIRKSEQDKHVTISIEYVNEGGYPDSIDVSPMRLIDGGDGE